ncbi:hypothetical protein [Eubacterium sp. LMAG:50]|uniref:hypothetical protein n=1 Tax=Eubacterium sp. LMAG:50 TaxID=1969563 RepID=UPI0025C40FCA|nr:hypothetical protein [Eubacterium sp. LMAG:50]
MRLIDADEVILHLNDFMLQQSPIDVQDIESIKVSAVIQDCIKAIENQQTAYDVDKVVEQLGKKQNNKGFGGTIQEIFYDSGLKDAIEIVKGGGMND